MTRRLLIAALAAAFTGPVFAGPAAADPPPAPALMIKVAAAGTEAKIGYSVTLQNTQPAPQTVMVTQRFTEAPKSVTASGDAKVDADGARWAAVEVPPLQAVVLTTDAVFASLSTPTRSSVCVAEVTGQIRDCLIGDLPASIAADRANSVVPWRDILMWVLALAAVGANVYVAYRWREKWYPPLMRWAKPRREMLAIAGAAVAVVLVFAALLGFVALRTKAAVSTATGANSVLTSRGQEALEIGAPATAGRAEFTVYQWSCASAEVRQCQAVVSIRNTATSAQPWYRRMQRLHETPEKWVEPDHEATWAANGGDIFAWPLAPGERRMGTLVFKTTDQDPLSWLELRDGAYPRGVSLSLR